jgi:hypothetical protein
MFVQSNRQEHSHDQADDAPASAHDRRHDDPHMSLSTQKIYVAAVANFSIFHGRSPDKLTFEDVRDYRFTL